METGANGLPAPDLWGLDPLFRSYVRLYISDLQKLTVCDYDLATGVESSSAASTGVFFYKKRPLTKVDLMGVIVKAEIKERFNKYAVDDGTGVISCTKWNNNKDALPVHCDLPLSLKEKLENIYHNDPAEECELGDYVNVIGSLKVFRNLTEVNAERIAIIKDPNAETARMLELPFLYTNSYDQLFALPPGFTMDESDSHSSHQKVVKDTIKKFVYAMKTNTVTAEGILCDMTELEIISEDIEAAMTDANIQLALEEMAQEGFLYQCCKGNGLYRVVNFDEDLMNAVMVILKKAGKIQKYAEHGCHYMYVKDQVCLSLQFSKIQPKAVLNCLSTLEKHSKVYSVSSDRHFLSI